MTITINISSETLSKFTKAGILNFVYSLVCTAAGLSSETGLLDSVIPHQYRHYVTSVSFLAMQLKSHWNLFATPPNSPVPGAKEV